MPDGGATSCGRWFPARPSWGGSSRRSRNIRLARRPERLAWKRRFSSFRLEPPEAANNGECLMKTGTHSSTRPVRPHHLLGLINDVLDLSKIEAGQLTLSLADYSLGEIVHGVVAAVEPLAAEKRLNFKAEVAPDLPAGRGDERRLSQVLLNLVGFHEV